MIENLESGISVNSSDEKTGYFILKTSAVKSGVVDLTEVKEIVKEELERAKTSIKKDSIIISRMNTPDLVGASGLVTISKENVFLPDRLWQGKVAQKTSARWLIQAINTITNIRRIQYLATGTSKSMKNISKPEMLGLKLITPNLDEQTKIGNFFKQLDDTIALQERKLDLLKEQKKGFLQKMFPKKDEKVPEIRFKGFTDDWEQRKLGEISNKVQEKNRSREYTETLTNSAEFGIISQNDFFDKEISNKKNLDGYYIVKPDDFVYNPRISNHAPVGPIKRNRLGRIGVMSPLYYVFKPTGIDETYLETYFDTTYWHRFMKLNGDSGARADRFAIKDSVFKEMPIPYPIIKEQEKIGNFFEYLNDTIALQEREVTELKAMKKSFLQKMFV